MTPLVRPSIEAMTDRQIADRMEAVNDRLRKTIEDQAFTIHVHEKSLDEYAATVRTREQRIEMLEDVNKALSRENAALTFEIKRLEELVEVRG